VVLLEHLLRRLQFQVVGRAVLPGQQQNPVKVGACDVVLGARRIDSLQALQFTLSLLPDLFGEVLLREPLPQLLRLGGLYVSLAQLILDGLQLLAKVVFPLPFVDLASRLGLYLLGDLHQLHLARQQRSGALQPLLDIQGLKDCLLLPD